VKSELPAVVPVLVALAIFAHLLYGQKKAR